MGRTKSFNPDDVLNRAMLLFWSRGYEATTVADLEKHLGINKFSLYNTFGNKQQLYIKALDSYINTRFAMMLSILNAPPHNLQSINQFFQTITAVLSAQSQVDGCFVVNAGIERSASDPEVHTKIQSVYQDLEDGFYLCLKTARSAGQLASDIDLKAAARFLLVQAQGLLAVSRNEQGTRICTSALEFVQWLIHSMGRSQ